MVEKNIIIKNPTGLHARPASMLVKEANKYKSEIKIIKNGKEANAKSILSLLSLGISKDSEVTIKVSGDDENEAINAIINLIDTFEE